jgi:hypothetical protein
VLVRAYSASELMRTDVRSLRRLDRAHATVMGRMHVTHFEARALARQTARSEGRYAALVRDLRQRVRLVHELRQLREPKNSRIAAETGFALMRSCGIRFSTRPATAAP